MYSIYEYSKNRFALEPFQFESLFATWVTFIQNIIKYEVTLGDF